MPPATENNSTGNWREAFAHAEALASASRDAQREALARLDADDPQLARRVALMLGGETTHANFDAAVTKVFGNARVKSEVAFKADDNIGAYTLIRSLGKGGMADVWLAQRTDGNLKRPVALKLPMAVMPSPMLAERFARERDMLAQLDHPNIARIYDAGTTDTGQPFLALEFIDGEPLDHFCRAKRSTIQERVQLIIQVAQGVHHAHSRLVLHRDLKPSNILVTREGLVKVLDFGIAKLLSEERTAEETQFTRMTGAALTPKYAAPEQCLSETVTTSTDVYAIAVVLYELLAGCVPFTDQAKDLSARMATLNNPCRLLSENAISAPQVLALDESSERQVKRALAGDLTAILDKALRRAPNDRYPSALAYAEDLERYLSYRPVLARQGAVAYRLRKFLTRHLVPVAVAAMGTLAAAGLGLQAISQSQKAAQSQSRADSIDGLMESLFQGMSPDVAAKRTFTAKELLDRASGYLTSNGTITAETALTTNSKMATLYRDIGEYRDAIKIRSAMLTEAQKSANIPQQIALLRELANCAWRGNDFTLAQGHVESAHSLIKSSGMTAPLELARLANIEGAIATRMFKYEVAKTRYAYAESLWRQYQPENVEELAWAIEGQAIVDQVNGDLKSARERYNAVVALDTQYPRRGTTDRIHTHAQLAALSYLDGRFAEANPPLKRACNDIIERLSVAHPDTHITCFNFAYSSIRLGLWDDGTKMIDTLHGNLAYRESPGKPTLQLKSLLAMYRGNAEEAEAGFKLIGSSYRQLESTPTIADNILRFERLEAEAALRAGKTAPACEMLRRVERAYIEKAGEASVNVAATRILLTVCALRNGDRAAAKLLIASASDTLQKSRGDHHPFTLAAFAYRALAGDTPQNTVETERIRNELIWQSGAQQLIEYIEDRGRQLDPSRTPVVL